MDRHLKEELFQDFSQFTKIITSAINSLKDIFYIMQVHNQSFTYLFANQAGQAFLKFHTNMFGKSFLDLLPENRAKFLHFQYSKATTYNKTVTFEEDLEIHGNWVTYETVLTPIHIDNQTYIVAVVRDVTERSEKIEELQRSQHLLEKNQQRLSSLVENNEDGVFMLDTDGFFLEANPATKEIIGYTPLEIVGTSFAQLVAKKESTKIKHYFQQVLAGENVHYESIVYHKDGHEVYIQFKHIPIVINGQVTGIYGIAKDITKEKKTVEELQYIKSQLESFIYNNTDCIVIMDVNGKVEFTNEAFLKTFGFEKSEVIHYLNPSIPDWLKYEANEYYQLVKQGANIQNVHLKRQKKDGTLLDVSVTLSPIYNEYGEVISISSILRDITEYKKNEMDIKRIKDELELVWDYSMDAIFMIGQDGSLKKVNPTFEEMFQWNREETSSLFLQDIYLDQHKHQQEEFLKILREQKKMMCFETKRKRKDGSVIDVIATYRPVDNDKTLAVATYKNITKEKQVLEKLTESEERYRKVVEFSPDPLIIHNGKVITYINQAGLKMVKATNESEVIGKSILEFVHTPHKDIVTNRVQHAFQNGERGSLIEEQFYTLDGDIIYAEVTSAVIKEQGETSVIVMLRDVTQRRRAEKALRDSEEKFRIITENSKDLIKVLTPEGKMMFVSPSVEETLGYPIHTMIGKSIFEHIHPDDLTIAKQAWQEMMQKKESMEFEIRHIHQEGTAIWLYSHFTPILSDEGQLEKIVLISDDVTEIKREQQKLKKMAYFDHLTGLPNRRLFNKHLKQAMLTSQKKGNSTAVMMLDCDKFKQVNDTFGHDVGDEVIKEFSRRIKSSLRKKDTVSRVGGDEFTVVIPDVNSKEEIIEISHRILKTMQQPMVINGHHLQMTASIGVACYPENANNAEDLLKNADLNLYQSKERGRNTFTL